MQRLLWNSLGFIAVTIGIIGAFLPILPTVPFMILAAYCFAKGSQRFHDWLVYHPVFGPPIRNWQTHRAIPRRAKYMMTLMLSISLPFTAYLLGQTYWWVSAILITTCLIVALWLWRLPDS